MNVYIITTIHEPTTLHPERDYRAVGIFREFEHAEENVLTNNCDLYEEGYYHYAVIEKCQVDCLYGTAFQDEIQFYKWIDGKYEKVEIPEQYKRISGFGGF